MLQIPICDRFILYRVVQLFGGAQGLISLVVCMCLKIAEEHML